MSCSLCWLLLGFVLISTFLRCGVDPAIGDDCTVYFQMFDGSLWAFGP